jgi:hypothetical protein
MRQPPARGIEQATVPFRRARATLEVANLSGLHRARTSSSFFLNAVFVLTVFDEVVISLEAAAQPANELLGLGLWVVVGFSNVPASALNGLPS